MSYTIEVGSKPFCVNDSTDKQDNKTFSVKVNRLSQKLDTGRVIPEEVMFYDKFAKTLMDECEHGHDIETKAAADFLKAELNAADNSSVLVLSAFTFINRVKANSDEMKQLYHSIAFDGILDSNFPCKVDYLVFMVDEGEIDESDVKGFTFKHNVKAGYRDMSAFAVKVG